MNRKLYLECSSGISGDMTVAALLDLGADEQVLRQALESLELDGYEIRISRVKKAGIDACDFAVCLDTVHENHDHDMEYLHGKGQVHEEAHTHENMHEKAHMHRTLDDVIRIIQNGTLNEQVKKIAIRIFTILAEAEAKAHGVSVQEVHFHEVGAVDSIVDIVAVAVCMDNLGITDVIVQALYEGRGCIRCQHGVIPVPVPAVANIVQQHGLRLHLTEDEGEFVTPTGAAIVACLKTADRLPEQFRILKTGIGAGKRNYNRPGILRAMLIEDTSQKEASDIIWKLETNIDDCTGECLGYVMERLLEAGARDVHYIPVFMKKNRPAYQLTVICTKENISGLEEIIFLNTTTIGIRRMQMERTILQRECHTVKTSLGEVKIKVCRLSDERRIYPEYESIREISRRHGRTYQDVWNQVREECYMLLD